MSRNPPRYRALLPITTPHSRPALPPSTSVSALGPEPVPKRKATRVACRECHEKKRKVRLLPPVNCHAPLVAD